MKKYTLQLIVEAQVGDIIPESIVKKYLKDALLAKIEEIESKNLKDIAKIEEIKK